MTVTLENNAALTAFMVKGLAFALLMVLSAQAVIPVPGIPVPITLQVLTIFAGAMVLGPVESGMGMLFYIMLGGMGFAVFANGTAMSGLGATTGYIIGMAFAAPLISFLRERMNHVSACIVGLFMIYFAGIAFLCIYMHISPIHAFVVGVLPFLVPDLLKLGLAVTIIGKIQ